MYLEIIKSKLYLRIKQMLPYQYFNILNKQITSNEKIKSIFFINERLIVFMLLLLLMRVNMFILRQERRKNGTFSQTLPKLSLKKQQDELNSPLLPSILGQSIINFSKIDQKNQQKANTLIPSYISIKQNINFKQQQRKKYSFPIDRPTKLFAFERYLKRHSISRYPRPQIIKKQIIALQKLRAPKQRNINDELFLNNNKKLESPEISISTKTNLFEIRPRQSNIQTQAKFYVKDKQPFRFYVGPGNNGQVVKKILQSRSCWVQTVEHDTIFNLRWEQYTDKNWYSRIVYERYKQLVNHFQTHQQISTKAGLLRSLKKYCSRNGVNIFDFMPVSFILDSSMPDKFQEQLKNFVFYYLQNHPGDKNIKKERCYIDFVKSLTFGTSKILNFSFEKVNTSSIPPLSNVYVDKDQYVWMLKPSELNRGRGIKIWNTLESLSDILSKACNQKMSGDNFVIQKYIQKPLLINNRKFDIRVWVLVSQKGKIYIFEEGYIRTSCQQYDLNTINNQYIHLTNNAIQKNSQKYGQYQDGNQMSFKDFDSIFPQLGEFRTNIFPQISRICSLTIFSALKNLLNKTKSAFQIFGFDFMLDCNSKVWLIQVNTNPCLETSSQLLTKLIPRMLDDAFKITLDYIFPGNKNNSIYPVPHYQDNVNMWAILSNPFQAIPSIN